MNNVLRNIMLATGAVILVRFLSTFDVSGLRRVVSGISPALLAAALLASTANIALKAIRWRWLIRQSTSIVISPGVAFGSVYAGVASASLIPGRVVDFAKPLILRGIYSISLTRSTVAMLLERVMDTLMIALIFVFALAFIPATRGSIVQTLILPLAVVFLVVILSGLSLNRRMLGPLERLLRWIPMPGSVRGTLLKVAEDALEGLETWTGRRNLPSILMLSFIVTALEVLRFQLVLLAVGFKVDVLSISLVYTASILVSFVSFIPGGIGITEAFQAAALSLLVSGGEASELARGAVIIDRLISYYLVVAIGAVLLMLYHTAMKASPEEAETPR